MQPDINHQRMKWTDMVQIPVCHILAVQLWASDLTSLSFDLFIGKARAIYSELDK